MWSSDGRFEYFMEILISTDGLGLVPVKLVPATQITFKFRKNKNVKKEIVPLVYRRTSKQARVYTLFNEQRITALCPRLT